MTYLDNAATTYPKPESVYSAMDKANREMAFNAGRGSYAVAREATKLVDETKTLLLKLVHANGIGKVAFTASITIALNELLQGIEFIPGDNLYISPYEHNAVARVTNLIKKNKGINVIQMPLDERTLEIDLEKLQYMFAHSRPKAVCCIHVSNVTGYILPVQEIFELSKPYDAITILDTAQSLGLVDIDCSKMNLDYLTFAGHKSLYGPLGIGGIIDLSSRKLKTFIAGGTGSNSLNLEMPSESPYSFESSSLNIIAVSGLNAALKALPGEEELSKEKRLIKRLCEDLQAIKKVHVYLPPQELHAGVISFVVEGYKAEDIGIILDEDYDIAVRTGYHCAPFIHEYLKDYDYSGTVRIGIGRFNTEEDVKKLVEAIKEL